MIYISVLLSVWFVLWLMFTFQKRDILKSIISWLQEDYIEDDIDPLLEKSEKNGVYHLNCEHCNHLWWSIEPNVNYCPNCGKKPHE